MIRVFFLVFIIAAFIWFKSYLQKKTVERKRFIKISALYVIGLSIMLLAMTGRLNWIAAAMGVLVAFATRFLPLVLRYAPQLQRLWQQFGERGGYKANQSGGRPHSATMTTEEAYKILGVSVSATRQEIIEAHRKLMLKNHPDRGGSSYLAAQINRAKELLIKN